MKQRGVALITVLLVVAIVVVLAMEMSGRLQLNLQRAQNIKDNNQAQWYALSAEEFARISIEKLMETEKEKIHLEQPWAEEFTFPLDGGGLTANLVDMQSCFNLNALAKASSDSANNSQLKPTPVMEAFHRMLSAVEFAEPIDNYTIDTVRDSLADWLDADDRMREYGAEDAEYSGREFPYLAANGLMASQSELRVIHGVSAQWINELWPLVCVIPKSDALKVNVNTLSEKQAPLLAGLLGVTRQQANDIIGRRPGDGWDSVEDFTNEPVVQNANLTEEQIEWLTITTEYFILHTKTRYNNATFALSSLFYVQQSNATAHVIRREFGGIE